MMAATEAADPPHPAVPRRLGRAVVALTREPLAHFLLIGALLVAASSWLAPPSRPRVLVDARTVGHLVAQRQQAQPGPLDEDERAKLVDAYIDEEILFREALAHGLERGPQVRRMLVAQMRDRLAVELPEPDEAELRAYYAENIANHRRDPAVRFEEVFFAAAEEVPSTLLAALESGADVPAEGEAAWLDRSSFMQATERDLGQMLGSTAARAILELPIDRWSGPIVSTRGVHVVRLHERVPGGAPSFDAVQEYVAEDWRSSRLRAKLAELRRGYDVDGAGRPQVDQIGR